MKNVFLLHTTEAVHYVTHDEKKNPYIYIYKICDLTKIGIDIPDQKISFLTFRQKTRKWTLVSLAYVLDMSRVNSQRIYAINTRYTSTKSFEFSWELMISLIKPHMSNQITIGRLSSNLEGSISVYLDQAGEVDPPPPNDDKARVCRVCEKEKHSPG